MRILNVVVTGIALSTIIATSVLAAEVRQVAEIKAAPAAVWAKVGEWCSIKDWHPAIAGCDAGKKGFRVLTLKDGGKIVEKLTKTGKYSYSYDIIEGPLPVKNYSATLQAKPDSLGTTDLTWTTKFEPKGKTEAEAVAVIKGIFEAGLKNIKDNVKFDAPAAGAAPAAAGAAATAAGAAAAVTDKAAERQKKIEAAKLYALEKVAKAKEEFAKARAVLAEKAKAAADAAKAAYEKAKAAMMDATKKMEEPKK